MSEPKRNIYVASSWRNTYQPHVVRRLREAGHDVYDFRNPAPGNTGFAWSSIDPDWLKWTPESFRTALDHPIACDGFKLDMDALRASDTCVLVLPCGRSAHLEIGWAAGAARQTFVYAPELPEPELMYRMLGPICLSIDDLLYQMRSRP